MLISVVKALRKKYHSAPVFRSDNFRFELAYGYGVLERFNLKGTTHFFQSRLQFTLRQRH
jgi:hypothetical protein